MGLTAAIILIIALVVLLFVALTFVMSRPNKLRPHQPGRTLAHLRRARRPQRGA